MDCDICNKHSTGDDDFLCPSCARSLVYLSRLEVARLLLENEQLHQQVLTAVDTSTKTTADHSALAPANNVWRGEMLNAERVATRERIQEARASAKTMKEEVEKMRLDIKARKQKLAVRKTAVETVEKTIPLRRRASTSALSELREKGMASFNNVSTRSTNTRAFFCRETAALLRLRQKRKAKAGTVTDQFSITGLTLPDLREINNMKCTDLTASLTSTVHLLVLVAFYLGVRLPAEITIPHRNYPLPTINTPAQSYLGYKVAFPGSGSISTTPSSPFSSKNDIRGPYRPRPLFVGSDDREEKIAQFAKRDPTAFNFFVEGVSLLAWNIAWLCRTQGFSQGTTSWEGICDIGRNLHQLIFGQPQSPALLRVLSSREAQKRRGSSSGTSTPGSDGPTISFAKLGQASHNSAHAFLGQASFNEQSRNWKYTKYNAIADPLKKNLLTEMNNAEWELLQEQEWDDGGEQFDEAVFIKARGTDNRDDDARSVMTAKAQAEDEAQPTASDRDHEHGKSKGKSGWTKLKSRNEE